MKFIFAKEQCTPLQASLLAVMNYGLFSICDSMGKWLQADGFSFSLILVITSLPSLILFSMIRARRYGIRRAYQTHAPKMHLLRIVALIGVTFCLFNGIAVMPLADYYGIVFASPFMVTIGAVIFFKEKTSVIDWIAIAAGFVGVLIIINPTYGGGMHMGHLYALGQALCITIAGLSVRKIGSNEDPLLFVIFSNLGVTLANLYPALISDIPGFTAAHIMVFIVYACLMPLAILLMSAVFAKAPSITNITPFQYTQLIWAAIIGWFVFHTIPAPNVVLGSIIVMSCGLFILFHTHRKSRRAKHHAISTRMPYMEHARDDSK